MATFHELLRPAEDGHQKMVFAHDLFGELDNRGVRDIDLPSQTGFGFAESEGKIGQTGLSKEPQVA